MSVETEYKFAVENIKKVERLLSGIAEPILDRQYQSNVMFDNKEKLMQYTNGRVRVRVLGDTGNKVLTYKKPLRSTNGAKRETEYEVTFFDAKNNIESILKALEFSPTTSYERYRSEWKLDGATITLDEYPFANFIEIEGKQQNIQRVVKKLNFHVADALTDPADTLFQKWRKEHGLSFKAHLRFDDYDK
ncbi:MAG: class IV adenylate cyclase [Candidatus Nomurabacteria bacterium]|nr:class IV adenylate cyclase [Candidatus Nomurabacteria bacterium]